MSYKPSFFYLYIQHAPLLSAVLHAMLHFIYMYSFVIITVHCLLSTLLLIIKIYCFDKPAEDLLVLVDQVFLLVGHAPICRIMISRCSVVF